MSNSQIFHLFVYVSAHMPCVWSSENFGSRFSSFTFVLRQSLSCCCCCAANSRGPPAFPPLSPVFVSHLPTKCCTLLGYAYRCMSSQVSPIPTFTEVPGIKPGFLGLHRKRFWPWDFLSDSKCAANLTQELLFWKTLRLNSHESSLSWFVAVASAPACFLTFPGHLCHLYSLCHTCSRHCLLSFVIN